MVTAPVKPLVWRASLNRNRRRIDELRRAAGPGQRLVAIALTEHLGDIVAAEPVARHLRARQPAARIFWICRAGYRELPALFSAVDEVMTVTCLTEYWQLAANSPFDELVDLHIAGRKCHWQPQSKEPRVESARVHAGNYFEQGSLLESFCASAGLPALTDAPVLRLPSGISAAVRQRLPAGSYWVVHAASNHMEKDWPVEKWRALVGQLSTPAMKRQFVEIGLAPRLAGGSLPVRNLCGRLTLTELAEVIRQSAGFIGIDSGPAHLANALERPSVILLGRYRTFAHYQPFTGFLAENAEAMLIHGNGTVAEIPVEPVAQKFLRLPAAGRAGVD